MSISSFRGRATQISKERSLLMLVVVRASRERRDPREVCVNEYAIESIHGVFIIMSMAACMNSNS